MKLSDIELNGLGRFIDKKCGFRVERRDLEEPWGYIYATPKLLLKVDQRGPDYAQFLPPSGSVLFRRERHQSIPSCLMWIKTADGEVFSNFNPATAGEFSCEYTPERVLYHVERDRLACETEIFVPEEDAVVVVTYTVTSSDAGTREIDLIPVLRPHFAASSLAPWDSPPLYQTVGYSNEGSHLFFMELRSPAGIPELREYAFALSDIESPDGVEVNYDSFIGGGTFESPDALRGSAMTIHGGTEFLFGNYTPANSVIGRQGVIAFRKKLSLAPGESFSFTLVIGTANPRGGAKRIRQAHRRPSLADLSRFEKYLDTSARRQAMKASLDATEGFLSRREIATPDEAFNRYVNEWLPLQLKWVKLLDRGWPTGMRGVRDHAQDTTALIPLDPAACRRTLLELFSIQRSDGWFPRQYSVKGRHGTHDLRNYVDGGVWVWELLYDYLCFTKDFALLREEAPYLDDDRQASVLQHSIDLISYYLDERNIGEHGLCLIREGDWNDSVNRAGLEGRGESVMVSCQLVLLLRQLADLATRLGPVPDTLNSQLSTPNSVADRLKQSILAHALNSDGYLSGVFTDNGEWVFSPHDPDGRRRVSMPVNSFGIISGVLDGDNARRAMEVLMSLKQTDGWPLFHPPIGDPPIEKLGRIGAGDLSPGLGENGTMYNHGCHGFFGRAAAAAGNGDLLIEILRYMLPYDQERHPVRRSLTAPYGVVNHWKTAPGLEGRGGDCFLSGSISTALRNVYNGLLGIRPMLDALALDPVLPSDWENASVKFSYLGAEVTVTYTSQAGKAGLTVNGEEIASKRKDLALGSEYFTIPDEVFKSGGRYDIRMRVGE